MSDLDRSIAFYTAVGYEVVGRVPETPIGELTMLKLPDDEFVTIELVHDPSRSRRQRWHQPSATSSSWSTSMAATIAELSARGIDAEEPTSPDGSDDFLTTSIVDPDGNRIELVQWPAGHAEGFTAADWAP